MVLSNGAWSFEQTWVQIDRGPRRRVSDRGGASWQGSN
jgi:hypothetical protein